MNTILDRVTQPLDRLPPVGGPNRVTVVVPVLNGRQWIGQCLDSIVSQEKVSTEIVVMDGGSTDGTVDVVKSYGREISSLFSGPDGGQAAALVAGFGRSTSEYLTWLNADDWLTPGALERAVAALRDSGAALAYGDYLVLHESTGTITYKPKVAFDRFVCALAYCMVPQPGSVFRRDAYEAVGGIDPGFSFSMDFDLFLRLGMQFPAVHIPAPQSVFRVHEESKSSAQSDLFQGEDEQIRQRLFGSAWESRGKQGLHAFALVALAARFARERRHLPLRKDRSFA